MKKLLFVAAIVAALGFVRPAMAQDNDTKWDVYGGYYYVHASVSFGGGGTTAAAGVVREVLGGGDPALGFDFNGGGGQLEYKFNHSLSFVTDLAGYHTWSNGSDLEVFNYLFGPRFSFGGDRYTPFVQTLFGGARASEAGGSQNGFAWTVGGGVDIKVTEHFFFRPVQAEYMLTRFNFGGGSNNQNNFRYSTGIGFRF